MERGCVFTRFLEQSVSVERNPLVADWVLRVATRIRAALRARRRDRGERCIRCGAVASAVCTACGSLACERCWLPSIETGELAILCLDCTNAPRPRPRGRFDAIETARSGAIALAWMLGGLALYAGWKHGAAGAWRVVALVFDPGILLGLVPLAFLVGTVRALVIRALRAALTSPSHRSS